MTIAIAVVVLALVAILWVAWTSAPSKVDSTVQVPLSPERVIERLVLTLADSDHDLAPGSTTLTLTRRVNQVWPIVVAVVAFPFGLLALLFRTTERTVIAATPAPGGAYVTMRGTIQNRAFDRIDGELIAMRSAAVVAPPAIDQPS
jgi:hypothetical protein